MLDYDYCKTFQAYFYSVYLLELEPSERVLIQKRIDVIEQRYRRLVELQDFPYLEVTYQNEHDAFSLWFASINRVSSLHQKQLISSIVNDAKETEQPLTFELFEKYNFHRSKIDDVTAYCCLFAKPRDWIRVGRYLLDNGTPGEPFLPEYLWREFILPDLTVSQRHESTYGWHLRHDILDREGERLAGPFAYFMGHGGQMLYILPESDMVVVRFGDRLQLLHSTLYELVPKT